MNKFYKCSICGQIVVKIKDTKVPLVCCGKEMNEIIPNTTDAAHEKHVPVIKVEGNKVTVTVGETLHPMVDVHYIEWILLSTDKGNQRKELMPGDKPEAVFYIEKDEKVEEAYAYCNLHSLWAKKF